MAFKLESAGRRIVATIGTASLALLVAVPSAGATTLSPTIDTYSGWNGTDTIQPFGNPQTSTYGEVVTIPAGKTKLKWFTYYLADNSGTGTLTFRAEVYGWDGSKASGKVYQSKRKTLDITAGDPTYFPVKTRIKGGAPVKAGNQYVLFLSISKDYEDNPPGVLAQWAARYDDPLPGGFAAFQNDDGDESQWTTTPWSFFSTFDYAMKAKLT